jgi:hypothetical protein
VAGINTRKGELLASSPRGLLIHSIAAVITVSHQQWAHASNIVRVVRIVARAH